MRLTSFPALRRLAAVEGENARSHQDVVKMLQLLCLLSKLLAASKGHEIGFPDQNVGNGLSSITQFLLDLLLDLSAVLDIDKNKGLDITMGKELGSSRTKRSIGTSDECSPALVRFSAYGRSAVTLLVQALPREVLGQEQRNAKGQADHNESARHGNV